MASAADGVDTPAALQPSDTFRVVGLPLWPSVGGNPNATVGQCEMQRAFSLQRAAAVLTDMAKGLWRVNLAACQLGQTAESTRVALAELTQVVSSISECNAGGTEQPDRLLPQCRKVSCIHCVVAAIGCRKPFVGSTAPILDDCC
jgi:hypothetical protein